jgi:NADP-dependent 3-hydroxy acid dehydrogenase YdfG
MVDIKVFRESNAKFKETNSPGTVALFVGGTSGIGKGTLIQFVKHANTPTVYVVGRSKSAFSPLLDELQNLNPQSTIIFIESEISLIRNVDKVCEQIKAKEKKLDLIFLSPGFLSFEARQGTPFILHP